MQNAAFVSEKCNVRFVNEQNFADSTYQNQCALLCGKAQVEINGQEGDGEQQQSAEHQYQPHAVHPRAAGFALEEDVVDQLEEAHAQQQPRRADGDVEAQQHVGGIFKQLLRIVVVKETEG